MPAAIHIKRDSRSRQPMLPTGERRHGRETMNQVLQRLQDGTTQLAEVPAPSAGSGQLLIQTTASLISTGTERMLVEFGKANWLDKARQQPDKVRMVLEKVRTDGLVAAV